MSAIKRIISLALVLMVAAYGLPAVASETESIFDISGPNAGVKDTDGAITIKGNLLIDGGIPVTLMVATQIIDSDSNTDITKERISNASTITEFLNLVEYTKTFILPDDGEIDLSFNAKDSMATGKANIYVSYNGGDELVKIGEFEHVGKDDVNGLVWSFNNNPMEDFSNIIEEDNENGEILRKIGADTQGYSEVLDKDAFETILFSKKGEDEFDSLSLISSFNESVAWAKLWEAEDALNVLKTYNSVYWNVDVSAESDFYKLSDAEKKVVLDTLQGAELKERSLLESAFAENVAIAVFRSVADRNALSELLDKETYDEYFSQAKKAVEDSKLNEYKIISVYNYVIENNSNLKTIEDINKLFKTAIDKVKSSSGSGGGGGGGGGGFSGGSSGTSSSNGENQTNPILKVPAEIEQLSPEEGFIRIDKHPFGDVAESHWANQYIAQMYNEGIISGKSENSFDPDGKITRQDFVKMIVSALKLGSSKNTSVFEDIEKGSLYEPFVMTAVDNGIINGTGENLFGMGLNIKREDVSVILYRATKEKITENPGDEKTFIDSSEISEYAVEAATFCAKYGIFNGDTENRFNPQSGLTRAEAAALISRLMKLLNN